MGRKTYESIGKPLPGREMIIVTRDKRYTAPGCLVTGSPAEALAHCRAHGHSKVFIIGGEALFRQTLQHCTHIILTTLARPVKGDILFPELPPGTFILEQSETITVPEPYTIERFRRI